MVRPLTLEQAKARYVHRFTMEHVPAWALKPNGALFYAPQFATDREWYDATLFPGEGHLSKRDKYCFTSGQTWPLGNALGQPFNRVR